MADQQIALRKRQQIAKSGRSMFIWVACMAALVGICAVISYSLWQQLVFRTNVVDAKNKAASILRKDNDAVTPLRQNIQALATNTNLNQLKANQDEQALQVVLDALPADGNSLALGSSLQNSLLAGINGLSINALTVTPVGSEASNVASASSSSTVVAGNTVAFHVVVSSTNPDSLKQMLSQFERSIRVLDIDNLDIERSDNGYTMTVDAHAYYEPAQQVTLQDQTITATPAKGKK